MAAVVVIGVIGLVGGSLWYLQSHDARQRRNAENWDRIMERINRDFPKR